MAKHSKFFHTKPKKERVILASVRINGNRPLWSHKESLIELGNLTSSVGGDVVCKISQNLKKPNHTYLGSGKLEELRDIKEFDTLICDDELTPTQQRNLESALNGKKVLDRTALILDVFATRARTSEGRLQVELAQNQYLLPLHFLEYQCLSFYSDLHCKIKNHSPLLYLKEKILIKGVFRKANSFH